MYKAIKILDGNAVEVIFSGERVVLPKELQYKVDKYWSKQLEAGREYFNGEVFTLDKIITDKDVTKIIVKETTFAHFLYNRSINGGLGKYEVKTVFATGLVMTSDNKIVLGKMAKHTSRAGKVQLSGGGLEKGDLGENGIFNMKHSVRKEVNEELGLNCQDKQRVKNFNYYCTVAGDGENVAIVYKIQLLEKADDFLQRYNKFLNELKNKKEKAEFENIIFLNRNSNDTKFFIEKNRLNFASYLEELLQYSLSEA